MRAYIDTWLAYLKDANPAWGIPLLLGGLVMMFLGWQLHRLAIPTAMFLIGMCIGWILIASDAWRGIGTLGLGILLAVGGYYLTRWSVAALGGAVGAFVLCGYLSLYDSIAQGSPIVLWTLGSLGFVCGASVTFVLNRESVIGITSFIGTLMLVSGLNALTPFAAPSVYRTVCMFLSDYPGMLVPFLIGCPTTIAVLCQVGMANQSGVGTV